MIRSLVLVAVLAGCASKTNRYGNGLLELASGFSAKEVCSCLFVSENDEEHCRQWTRVSPNVARFKVDYVSKTVKARSLLMGKQIARYQGDGFGCTLDP